MTIEDSILAAILTCNIYVTVNPQLKPLCRPLCLKWPKQRCNIFVNPLLQDSGPASIATEVGQKNCNGGLTEVFQGRLAKETPRQLASLHWSTFVNPPLQCFSGPSIATLVRPESCNRGLTKVLQRCFGHFWPVCKLIQTIALQHMLYTTFATYKPILPALCGESWSLGTQESGLMRCACMGLLDDC